MDILHKNEQLEKGLAVLRARYQVQGVSDSELDILLASYIKSTEDSKFESIYREQRGKINRAIARRLRRKRSKAIGGIEASLGLLPVSFALVLAGHSELAGILCLGSLVLGSYSYIEKQRIENMSQRVAAAEKKADRYVEGIYRNLRLQQERS